MSELSTAQIAAKLRKRRIELGLSQQALGRKLGMPQSQISAAENGRFREIGQERLIKLSACLGVPSDDVSGLSEDVKLAMGMCSNPDCLTHDLVSGFGPGEGMVIVPHLIEVPDRGLVYCRACGDLVVRECEHCGLPLDPGIHCGNCGTARFEARVEMLDHESAPSLRGKSRAQQRALLESLGFDPRRSRVQAPAREERTPPEDSPVRSSPTPGTGAGADSPAQ